MGKRIVLLFLLCGVVLSQQTGIDWLNPSDEQIARAIDLGFQASKPPYHMFSFNPQKSKIGNDYVQQPSLTMITPLLCAFGAGINAHNGLKDKPDVVNAKKACLGKVIVILNHISPSLNANWPVVLERSGERMQPSNSHPDPSPAVTRYSTPLGEQVGYHYQDKYIFNVPQGWDAGFQLTYADDAGKHHVVDVDTAPFKKDVT